MSHFLSYHSFVWDNCKGLNKNLHNKLIFIPIVSLPNGKSGTRVVRGVISYAPSKRKELCMTFSLSGLITPFWNMGDPEPSPGSPMSRQLTINTLPSLHECLAMGIL